MLDVALESLPLFRPRPRTWTTPGLDSWTPGPGWSTDGLFGLWVTFFIVCLYLSQKICKLSRCSTVERIHSATFSTSCKRFAPFCQIDLNNFVPLHFPTCCVFFCNHLAARLNLISSATFSICCNLCLQISIGNIPFCRNDPLRYLFHILYTFCIFLSNRLEKFCSTTFSNLLCLFCNFLASRLNLTSSATFSNCCNLFLQISIGYIPFCRTDQLRYLFHILYIFCIYYIDLNGKKYILLSFPLAASICTAVLTVFLVNYPICT